MAWRVISLLLCQLLAVGAGWWAAPDGDALAAVLLMALVGLYMVSARCRAWHAFVALAAQWSPG